MFSGVGELDAFSTYDIFNSPWVYWEVNPLQVKEDLSRLQLLPPSSLPQPSHSKHPNCFYCPAHTTFSPLWSRIPSILSPLALPK